MALERAFASRLLVDWLNARFDSSFDITIGREEATLVASDGGRQAALFVAPLWDDDEAWSRRLDATARRIEAGIEGGSFVLWVPPKADVPSEEPLASDFVERVVSVAREMPAGARAEVAFPVQVTLGKMREEGGYASVIGGLSRWWTRITEKVNGTFHVDASRVHRITRDGDGRERLWDNIGALSHGLQVGQAADFEVEDAWTLQRLPDGETNGVAMIGAPPDIDPSDGVLLRRMARKRLSEANEAFGLIGVGGTSPNPPEDGVGGIYPNRPEERPLRCVGLMASYEYAELEGVGATVKGLTPSLFNQIEVVCVIADGEVRPIFAPKDRITRHNG